MKRKHHINEFRHLLLLTMPTVLRSLKNRFFWSLESKVSRHLNFTFPPGNYSFVQSYELNLNTDAHLMSENNIIQSNSIIPLFTLLIYTAFDSLRTIFCAVESLDGVCASWSSIAASSLDSTGATL